MANLGARGRSCSIIYSFPEVLGKKLCQTRMHSSNMRTAHSLTISHSICQEGGMCAMHAPAPLPCMLPVMHAPHHAHSLPCMPHHHHHACPLPFTPLLPCMPPATHAPPHHTCLHYHAGSSLVDRQTPVKNITFANFVCGR